MTLGRFGFGRRTAAGDSTGASNSGLSQTPLLESTQPVSSQPVSISSQLARTFLAEEKVVQCEMGRGTRVAAVRRCGGRDVLLHVHTPMYYKVNYVKTDYVEVLMIYMYIGTST